MIEFKNQQQPESDAPSIKVVGLGGAGLNALDRIVLDGAVPGADLAVMNTDVQSLTSSVAAYKVQLGRGVTRGLGTGGDPEIGFAAAHEAQEEIRKALDGASLIFIATGLGGGTGSGAAPLVAGIAREAGALVVAIATMPFTFEGKRRAHQAQEALAALQGHADAVICFENDVMGEAVSPKAGIHQAFASADQTISQCVRAIAGLFTQPGILHIGFDDLCAALRPATGQAGRCLFGYGEADGSNRAHDCLAHALRNPLMDKGRILDEAHNVLVNVSGGADMTLNEVQLLMDALSKHTGGGTQILFGATVDPSMSGRMAVTILSSAAIAAPAAMAAPVPAAPAPAPRVVPAPPVQAAPLPQPAGRSRRSKEPAPLPPAPAPEPVVEAADPAPDLVLASDAEAPEAEDPQVSLINLTTAPAGERPAPPQMRIPRPPRQPRILTAVGDPQPPLNPSAAQRREERQETLQFEPVTRGRFEKSEPTIVDGQDLDVPTFLRRNVKVS